MSNCPICLDENPDMILSNCSHAFHKVCINQWLELSVFCPLCRTPVRTTFEVKILGIPKTRYLSFISIGRRYCTLYNQNTVFYHLPYNIILRVLIGEQRTLLRRRPSNKSSTISLDTRINDDLGFSMDKTVKFRSVHADRILRMFLLHFRR